MKEIASSYYPPRAHWYSPFTRWRSRCNRWLANLLDRFPAGYTAAQVVLSVLWPGWSFVVSGHRRIGSTAVTLYLLGIAVFVVAIGRPAANVAFGLMMAIHCASIVHLIGRADFDLSMFGRFGFVCGVGLCLGLLLYLPARRAFMNHVAMPLRVNGHLMLIRPGVAAAALKKGDEVAYRIHHLSGDGIYLREGVGLRPLLAGPGDLVVFREHQFTVNGLAHPRQGYMPTEGELRLPEKHWMLWPELQISGYGAGLSRIGSMAMRAAVVPESRFLGTAYQSWFGWQLTKP